MRHVAALVVLVVSSAALASQPGQPLDCSDWVFLQPGLSASYWFHNSTTGPHLDLLSARSAIDAEGRPLIVAHGDGRIELRAYVGGAEAVLGYVADRPSAWPNSFDRADIDTTYRGTQSPTCLNYNLNADGSCISFNQLQGRLILSFRSYYEGQTTPGGNPQYWSGVFYCQVDGFTTLFDVMQSYVPSSNGLAFRVPAMPEGLRAADHFDTYWGDVTRPLDLAQAHPLQCDYPAAPPSVGDYLTFADSAPTPAPGHANYCLTSVRYQGQTRAGRKATNGKLNGRDASKLPACVVAGSLSRQGTATTSTPPRRRASGVVGDE